MIRKAMSKIFLMRWTCKQFCSCGLHCPLPSLLPHAPANIYCFIPFPVGYYYGLPANKTKQKIPLSVKFLEFEQINLASII